MKPYVRTDVLSKTAAGVVYDPIGLEAGLDLFRGKPTVTPSPCSKGWAKVRLRKHPRGVDRHVR